MIRKTVAIRDELYIQDMNSIENKFQYSDKQIIL